MKQGYMKHGRTNQGTRHRLMLCTLLGGIAFASGAWANKDMDDKFKTMDSNGDGMISAAEHASAVTSMFAKMDANGDGNVTAAEMDAGMDMKHKGMHDKGGMHEMSSADKIAKMDTDGNGSLSAAEHDAGAQKMFQEMDTDGNGSLSRQEFNAGHKMKMKDKARSETSGT